MKGDINMKVEVNFDYWNTLYEYLNKDEFKLSGDIRHDAKIIERVKFLWQNASKEYLKNIDTDSLSQVWCDIDKIIENLSAKNTYNDVFVSYLFYATDRMSLNRWLFLQMCINRASDFIYNDYCKKYKAENWANEICNGYYEGSEEYFYNIEQDCEIEWKEQILPLIKQAQRNEG